MSLKKWISKYIPSPTYMSMSHVGVDISPTCIHILEMVKKSAHLELGRHGVEPLSSPINFNEPLSADEGLVTALKKLQKKYKLDFVEISIPEDHAYIFTMDLPHGTEEEIHNHIELHLEENVPVSLADAVYDYFAIEKLVEGKGVDNVNQAEVVSKNEPATFEATQGAEAGNTFLASISVVQKSLIEQYIELFELAGMKPVSFLIENQALSKSIIKNGVLDTKLIVHVGENKSVLSVVSNGSVHFTSTVNIGSEDFTTAIMKEFNVSREEAVRMKTERGTTEANQSSIFMSLINTASALKDEIDKIVLYWQSYIAKRGYASTNSVNGLILSGRDALINGFKEYLIATVKMPVETANVWSNIYNIEDRIPEIDYIDSLDYAVVVGLALPKIED